MNSKTLNGSDVREFLKSFDYVLVDCDGVLWHRNELIPGSREAIQCLRDEGKNIIFITNNSMQSRAQYLKKFQMLYFPANLEEIFSSAYCVALYLKSLKFTKKVYLIGSEGLSQELEEFGIRHLPIGPDPVTDTDALLNPPMDPEVGAVVVGFDIHFNYWKLTKSLWYLSNPDCLYVATNTDSQYPITEDKCLPGTGAMVAAVSRASGREPTVMGKPNPSMLHCIEKAHPQLDASRCLMIGDRLDTDIVMGKDNGMKTLLVLTGVTREDHLKVAPRNHLPDYYLPSLNDLNILLKSV